MEAGVSRQHYSMNNHLIVYVDTNQLEKWAAMETWNVLGQSNITVNSS